MKVYTIPVGSLQTNCYIIASKQNHAVIVDPGDDFETIVRALNTMGLTPGVILLTHAHYDHIGAVKQLREQYRHLKVALGAEDLDMLEDSHLSLGARLPNDTRFNELKADQLLRDGDMLEMDDLRFHAVETPGHTKGGMCYVIEDCIFSGDTLFRREVGRCDLYGGSYDMIVESIKRLYKLQGDYKVYPGHGEPTTLDEERRENPYVRL